MSGKEPMSDPSFTLTRMSAYNGRAAIITDDGTEVPVTANLSTRRNGLFTDWGGRLTPTSADGLQRVKTQSEGRLRLPDGREAQFLRPDTSDWVVGGGMAIIGQHEVPF